LISVVYMPFLKALMTTPKYFARPFVYESVGAEKL